MNSRGGQRRERNARSFDALTYPHSSSGISWGSSKSRIDLASPGCRDESLAVERLQRLVDNRRRRSEVDLKIRLGRCAAMPTHVRQDEREGLSLFGRIPSPFEVLWLDQQVMT